MGDDSTVYDGSDDGTVYDDTDDSATVSEIHERIDEEQLQISTAFSMPGGLRKNGVLLKTYRVDSDAILGGMGAIWRVRHLNWDVDLAMKRPKPDYFVTEKQKADFIHECDSWIKLGLHPNIVSCYYVREIDGIPTIFSEWMERGSLAGCIRDGSLYEGEDAEVKRRLLDIAIQFGRGLHFAHENGLIHQDVKPDNLLLTKDWDAKVSDFGLAKARTMITVLEGTWTVREDDPSATVVTPSGGRTPAYCSPEQAASQPLTRRTDIYSWAVSVLEMYLGCKPWAHGRELTGPMVGTVCNDYFEMCRIPLPLRLQRLLARCMALDPEDRYHDFGKVEAALKEIYAMETGAEYPRPAPKAEADTADSLNNRALSFLDLGREEEAVKLWDQALRTDHSNFRCHYNRAVTLWKMNRMTAEELLLLVTEKEEDTADWRSARAAVEFARVVTRDDLIREISRQLSREDPDRREWSTADFVERARRDGTPLPEEPIYHFPNGRYRWQEIRPDENGIYDRSRDGRRTISYDAGPGEYVVREEDREFRFPGRPLDRMGGGWKFVDEKGEILSVHDYDVNFINATTGRSLLTWHSDRDWDDDVIFDHIMSVSENGFVELDNGRPLSKWLRLPPADPKVDYLLSRIESFSERAEAYEGLQKNYAEAAEAFERADYAKALELLRPSCENGSLLQDEPSLELWEKLFPHCVPEKLITVLPSESLWRPISDETGNGDPDVAESEMELDTCVDGRLKLTAIETYTMSDNYHDTIDYDFKYALKGQDAGDERLIFTVDKLTTDSQDDENVIDYGLFMALSGTRLKYKKKAWPKVGVAELSDPAFQRKAGLHLTLPGTGEYFLTNVAAGVEIGGFLFEDEYRGLGPLLDAQVIQCRDRAYRLIYQYSGLRKEDTEKV